MEGNARRASDAGVPRFLAPLDLQLLIFGGKGGVGKTTCATAAALRLAARSPQSSFLLVSTDPAHSLADSLEDLVPPRNLKVLELNPQEYLLDFKKKHNDQLREIASRGTFLDDEEINRFLDLSLPGLDELMAFLEISAWVEKRVYDCIIVDTAPSGHTLRLLTMPQFLRKWVAMLETLLAKHRYMKWALARSRDRDNLDAFLDELTSSVEQMEAVLQDSARCSFVPVMLAEVMSLRETVAIVSEADRLQIPIDDIIINKLYPESHCPVCRGELYRQACGLRDLFLNTSLTRFALWGIPLHAEEVRGQIALQSFWEEARPIREPPAMVPAPRLSPGVKVQGIARDEGVGAHRARPPIRPILQLGDPRLREVALPVENPSAPEVRSLIQDLADTLAHWRLTTGYGRGIAAPQLGVSQRVIFLKLPGVEPWPVINPEIIEWSEEKIVVWDACLSFLSIFMQVERRREVTVRYQNLQGESLEFVAGDDRNLSELLQHEIDHLDGILAVDRIVDIKTLCTREEFEKRYRDSSPYAVSSPATIRL